MNIGFIGFGEAAYCIALGFCQNGITGIRANDAMMNHPVMGQQIHARAAEAQVELVEDAKEVARWADVLFAAVPSSFTMDVCNTVKDELRPGQIYADVSASTPATKVAIWDKIKDTGVLFADAAMLGSLPQDKHRVPITASGNGAEAFKTAMEPLVTAMCIAAGFGPSRSLLALLFGAQFGGFVTLVGVGSNATANEVMAQNGLNPFGFFSITPFGIGVCVLGTLYFVLLGRKLIPDTGYVPEFAQTEKKPLDKKKAIISVATLFAVLVVIAIAPKAFPMHLAAVCGALIILATKCMNLKDAIKAIDWNCMLLVGSLSAISLGVKNSGAGDMVANGILKLLGDNPSPFLVTTVIFFAAAILTQFMSNIPSIMLFLPIGVSIAQKIGVNPYPIAMTITLAGAASYATPFAAPQNMMTVGWTQYKFIDFIKIGLPMLLITYVAVVGLIPIFLPY